MEVSRRAVATALAVAACAGLVSAAQFRSTRPANPDAVRAELRSETDSLDQSLVRLASALRAFTRDADEPGVRAAFRAARIRFKRTEGAMEFYAPALAAAFNARRQEVDDDDAPPPSMLAASGFPALERLLWPRVDRGTVDSAARIVDGMRPLTARMRSLAAEVAPTNSQLVEIVRLELARVSTFGIAGFDAPLSRDAMPEGAAALDGLRALLHASDAEYWPRFHAERAAVDAAFERSATYLRANPDFERFNRLAFIVSYVEPAANSLDSLRRVSRTTPIRIPRAWRVDAPSPYSPNAFDTRAYAPVTSPAPTSTLTALGARLFVDPSLSGTGTRSCASCHVPGHAFTDGVPRAGSIDPGGTPVARNTPTLLNAGLQPAQFADERSVTLEDQVLEVLRSVSEMSSSAELASARLARDVRYRSAFAGAFDTPESAAVTPLHLRQALAAYVRSLVAVNSRFDRAIQGDTLALTSEERHGYTLFMGKGGCGTCHFAPLFSGVTPPLYLNSDVEVIGTPKVPSLPSIVDPDSGRARIDHLPIHLRAFKTPSLRNVAVTAPYMHNGSFRTLDDVMTFYERGGGLGSGARLANQTLGADSLHLSATERKAIVAFLGALTDTTR